MDTRERQINAVAGIIAAGDMTAADITAANAAGWTVEIGNGCDDGWWLRCEGVVLTPTELHMAIALANSWQVAHGRMVARDAITRKEG